MDLKDLLKVFTEKGKGSLWVVTSILLISHSTSKHWICNQNEMPFPRPLPPIPYLESFLVTS